MAVISYTHTIYKINVIVNVFTIIFSVSSFLSRAKGDLTRLQSFFIGIFAVHAPSLVETICTKSEKGYESVVVEIREKVQNSQYRVPV